MTSLLPKIMEVLSARDHLTVEEIQHDLKARFGIITARKMIVAAVEQNGDKLDTVRRSGKTTIIIRPSHRE